MNRIVCADEEEMISLYDVASNMRSVFEHMIADGHLHRKAGNESFGFSMTKPCTDVYGLWDSMYELSWFNFGWGVDRDRYIANALRKLRFSTREGMDSMCASTTHQHLVVNPVASEVDGLLPWGDFPFGGATFVRTGHIWFWCAVSTFTQQEDPLAAALLGHRLAVPLLNCSEFAQAS